MSVGIFDFFTTCYEAGSTEWVIFSGGGGVVLV